MSQEVKSLNRAHENLLNLNCIINKRYLFSIYFKNQLMLLISALTFLASSQVSESFVQKLNVKSQQFRR